MSNIESQATTHSFPFYITNHINLLFGSPKQSQEAASHLSPLTLHNTSTLQTLFLTGFITGAYLSSKSKSTQFLAENIHRLPKTREGWYTYHKHKNFSLIESGIHGGLRYAARFSLIGGVFLGVDSGVEGCIGSENGLSSVCAGALTGFGLGLIRKMGRRNVLLAMMVGGGVGSVVGLTHEIHGLVYGTSIRYPDEKRKLFNEYKIWN